MESLELDRIVFLLTDENFTAELKTFRRSLLRLKVRLRNNHLTGGLKHVKTLIHRLQTSFPVKLFQYYRTEKPKNRSLRALRLRLCQFIRHTDAIISKATLVYGSSQPHFKVGHLTQHYLVVRASLARLIFCFRALLVYSADLYLSIYKPVSSENLPKGEEGPIEYLSPENVKEILLSHNCEPRQEIENESPEILDENPTKKVKLDIPIGELIDRETMRPVRACRRK